MINHDVSVGRFAIHEMTVGLHEMEERGSLLIRVRLRVSDVETGELISTYNDHGLMRSELNEFSDPDALKHLIRDTCIQALAHELDEWLRVDGARVVEPHHEDR